MTNLKFHSLAELPSQLEVGHLYFLTDGTIHIGKSDGAALSFYNTLNEKVNQTDLDTTLADYYTNVSDNIMGLFNKLDTHELSLINTQQGLHGIRIWENKIEQFNSESFTWDEIKLNNNITAEDIGTYSKEQIDNAILNSGVKGDDGLSAYEVAINNGFVGTEIDWINSLKGENGANWYTLNGDLNSPLGNIGDYGINTNGRIFVKEAIGWTYSGTDLKGLQGEKGESGDSFSIVKTYATIAEMNSDFTNAELSIGSFVIISSDEPDTDPDNGKVYIKSDTEFRFHSILRGLRGETGKDGKTGERGRGVTVKGQVVGESDLPITAEVGDAYWTEDGRLYIWSDNPLEVAEPTFVRSPSLIGKEGQRGLKGEKGDTPTLNDATTTSKGVVQVGNGLTVNGGVLSVNNEAVTVTNISSQALFADYPNGVVTRRISSSVTDADYIYFANIIKDLIGTDLIDVQNGNYFRIYMTTTKTNGNAQQNVEISTNIANNFYPVFQIYRTYQNNVWSDWRAIVVENYGKGDPNSRLYGVYGAKYTDVVTNISYIKKGAFNSPSWNDWEPINGASITNTATVTRASTFNGTFNGTVTKQGIFTRLDLSFVNPNGTTVNAGTEVIVGVIPAGFRPPLRNSKFYVGDNTGNRTPRHAIIVYANGNIGWTPSVNAGYWTMDGSVVY